MRQYSNIKRVITSDVARSIKFNRHKPLRDFDEEELTDILNDLDLEFFRKEKKIPSFWVRLTLPIALIVFVVLFIFLPVNFIITGRWNYKLPFMENWFRSLGF